MNKTNLIIVMLALALTAGCDKSDDSAAPAGAEPQKAAATKQPAAPEAPKSDEKAKAKADEKLVEKTGDKTDGQTAKKPSGEKKTDMASQTVKISGPSLWDSVKDVDTACDAHIDEASRLRAQVLTAGGERTPLATLQLFNRILIELDRVMPQAELIANVHPDKAVRTAAEACEQKAKKFESDLKLDRGVYEALKAVPADGLAPEAKRFQKLLLREYRRSGVDRDEATRKRLAALDAEMVKLGQEFSRNIREDRRKIEVTEAQLAGLPADFIASRKKEGQDKITITTDYPDFYPVESYCEDESVRRELYKLYLSRAFPVNKAILERILAARHEYATTLGYSDWASYNAEDKMVKDKAVIGEFIERVATLARPRMDKDLQELLLRKQKDQPGAETIGSWDRFYYVKRIQAERFDVDPEEVRAYFPYTGVKEGVLEISQELFGVQFKRVDVPVWHKSVEAYDVLDDGKPVARFYLDMHPRDGKYGHAAEFPIVTGVTGTQLPSAALVTNFPDPSKSGAALMEHNQVTTFFHEFGHLMHQLLSGDHAWVTLSGINCEWDFVEAPSQLLEEWTWDADVLARFAKHHETGAAIPKDLVARMRKANEFGKGAHVMRQMFYAALSFGLHDRSPEGLDLDAALAEVRNKYSPFAHAEGTAVYANFGHLNGYSSMYYTYMWSLVLAKDLFTKFQENGLMDEATALAYRKSVLEPGGATDANDMVLAFLGRPSTFDAFERWLKAE